MVRKVDATLCNVDSHTGMVRIVAPLARISHRMRGEVGAWLEEGFSAAKFKKRHTLSQRVLCREVGEPAKNLPTWWQHKVLLC